MAANLLSFDFIRGRLSPEQLEDLAVSLGLCLRVRRRACCEGWGGCLQPLWTGLGF